MPRNNSREVRPEGLGSGGVGVFNPQDFSVFSADEPMIMGVYRDGVDLRHVTIRNFEPGQQTPLHVHPENAHCIYVLEGSGDVLVEGAPPIPISAGQFLIVPRDVPHGMANTGDERLSYLGVNGGAEPSS